MMTSFDIRDAKSVHIQNALNAVSAMYSRILLAGVGTAIALSWLWLVAMVLGGVYFAYSATVEERYLTEQFPDTYPV